MVRLDVMPNLWLQDLYEPWLDLMQGAVTTEINVLYPRPPVATTHMDTVHVMLEQHPLEAKAAGVLSAVFHGAHEDRLHQAGYSLPRWLCKEDLIDILGINHICDLQRCLCPFPILCQG